MKILIEVIGGVASVCTDRPLPEGTEILLRDYDNEAAGMNEPEHITSSTIPPPREVDHVEREFKRFRALPPQTP